MHCNMSIAILAQASNISSQQHLKPATSQASNISSMAFLTESAMRNARVNCSDAYPAAQPGLQALDLAVGVMVSGNLMAFVENHLLGLPESVCRLLSHYSAVGGCLAGHQWEERSHDATNVIYAMVWEYWKGEEHFLKFPTCNSITAGNIVEALLGVAWIHLHHNEGQDLDALLVSDALKEKASQFVRDWGSKCAAWEPVLEHAINGVHRVWEACPWVQTSKAAYNPELMQKHLQALRLGFPSGLPFHNHRLPVFPLAIHRQMYPEDVLQLLEEELHVA